MVTEILKSNWANLFYALNFILAIITLLVLIQYASDTKIIAAQSKQANIESNRPLILRTGWNDWGDIKFKFKEGFLEGKPLSFKVLKNVASNISGYIIIDGYKYNLLFGNNISQLNAKEYRYTPVWGWMEPNTDLYAVYRDDQKEKTGSKNEIYISYSDIQGNRYYTLEDETLSNPQSFPGELSSAR